MTSKLARIRQLVKDKAESPPVVEDAKEIPVVKQDEKPKDKPPKKPKEMVKYQCGHSRSLRDISNAPCPKCVAKKRKKKNAENLEKFKAKKTNDDQRLPDKSVFHLVYDATAKMWDGDLEIPGMTVMVDSNSGVFGLLSKLDMQYRKAK